MSPSANPSISAFSWKQEVSQRVAAHQNRRGDSGVTRVAPAQSRTANLRAAQAAARVAARFANAPSYSQIQQSEMRMAQTVEESASSTSVPARRNDPEQTAASAAAQKVAPAFSDASRPEVAADAQIARTPAAPVARIAPSRAAAASGPRLWEPGTLWDTTPVRTATPDARPLLAPAQPAAPASLDAWEKEWSRMRREPDFTLRPAGGGRARAARCEQAFTLATAVARLEPETTAERFEESKADRLPATAPDVIEQAVIEPVEPDLPIPANLIEFPRELVAPRKMRPRLAEAARGGQNAPTQLSIFEVDPVTAAIQLEAVAPSWSEPEWAGIELEDQLLDDEELSETAASQPALPVASIDRRLMAVLVDGALITTAFVAAALTAMVGISHVPAARFAELGAAIGLLLTGLLYQALFLTLGETTPGMRYARISLCTFDNARPSRAQLRSRLRALPLSVLPVGLGMAWMLFDDDRLSWHDRLSKTYPRQY